MSDEPLDLGEPDNLKNTHISFHCLKCEALESENKRYREALELLLKNCETGSLTRDKVKQVLAKSALDGGTK